MHYYQPHIGSRSRAWLVGLVAILGASQAAAQSCPITVTHSGANFTGGSFIAQAGFAQGEAAAASYVLNATEFPIKLNLVEMIFATSNASVQTVTQWEVFVYDGTPTNGTLVASFESDDVILPHLRIGPGTAGTNLQFSVDPNDPEQIFINNDSGTNTFTVGYRIIHHNDPPANPCLQSPNTSTNAFPTTDADGNLSQPNKNWLDALDCGALGAPGGWSTFGQLPIFVRPSGDWNIRTTYESVNPLTITSQPQPTMVPLGQPAIFQVTAAGPGTLRYQWYKGTTPLTPSSRIIGPTTDSLVIFPTLASDAGNYHVVVTNDCGSASSDNAALSFNGLPVSGHVTLGDWSASPSGQLARIEVHNVGSGSSLFTTNVTLDANGNFSMNLPSSITAGSYDFYCAGTHWLKKLRGNVVVSASGASGVNFTLINGDVDGNNEVGPGDFSQLSAAFGSTNGDPNWNVLADLDGNGEVGPSDFSILSGHFGESGD